jgi:hypothetical protein
MSSNDNDDKIIKIRSLCQNLSFSTRTQLAAEEVLLEDLARQNDTVRKKAKSIVTRQTRTGEKPVAVAAPKVYQQPQGG